MTNFTYEASNKDSGHPVKIRNFRILIVDDSSTCRNMVRKILSDVEGYTVYCDQANDGIQAVEMVKYNMEMYHSHAFVDGSNTKPHLPPHLKSSCKDIYDAILMDYQMPNMDGPTAIKAIRKLNYKGKIVGLTGNVMSSELGIMYDAGADEILSKPVNQEALENIVTG